MNDFTPPQFAVTGRPSMGQTVGILRDADAAQVGLLSTLIAQVRHGDDCTSSDLADRLYRTGQVTVGHTSITTDDVMRAWHDATCPEGQECRSRDLHALSAHSIAVTLYKTLDLLGVAVTTPEGTPT